MQRALTPMSLIVALIGPLPPPAGGMANQTRQLSELLLSEGVKVRTIQTQPPYRPAWVGRIPLIRAIARFVPYLLELWTRCYGAQVAHVMANSGLSWDLFAAPAVWIAKLRGAAVVLNYRGGEADAFLARAMWRVKPTLALVDCIIVPSDFLREVFARRGFECRVVPNIIDLERFAETRSNALNGDALRLLVARNLELLYDNETAIGAFRMVSEQVPNATLTIAGAGPDRERLLRLVDALGLVGRVNFVGQVENRDMPAVMRDADLMINPSLADNMPVSILEAFASGLPVVSTNVGGVPYLVSHEKTGLLVEPRNPSQMSAAILRIYRDKTLRARLVSTAAESVQDYTWARVWPLLRAVYREIAPSVGLQCHEIKR